MANMSPQPVPVEEPQACLEQWKTDLRNTNNALVIKTAEVARLTWSRDNATQWENKLKTYWDKVVRLNELTRAIADELDSFYRQAERVCQNTDCSVEAMEVLFCLLRDFFRCTDQLNARLAELGNKIKCLNDPNLNPNSSLILKCLEEMTGKLAKAIVTQHEMLKMAVGLLKQANVLQAAVCSDDSEDTDHCGFIDLLDQYRQLFTDNREQPTPQEPDEACVSELLPGGSCSGQLTPKPVLPLTEDEYYQLTQQQYQRAQEERRQTEEDLSNARKDKEGLDSYQKSLQEAVVASEKAKNCK